MTNLVGEYIRKLKTKKEIYQDYLSKDANLLLNTVEKIETGQRLDTAVDTLEKIAKIISVDNVIIQSVND